MSEGTHAFGTTLTGSEAGLIAQITNVGIDGVSVEDLDITNHDSPNKWKEYIGGLIEGGECPMEFIYTSDVVDTIMANLGVTQTWTIAFPSGASWEFEGYIKGFSNPMPHDDAIRNSGAIKISGEITYVGV